MTEMLIDQLVLVAIYGGASWAVTYVVMSRRREREANAKVTEEFQPTEDRWAAANEMASVATGEGKGGLHRRSAAVGKPPVLIPEPDPRQSGVWPTNPARGRASVRRQWWEELDVMGDVLSGRVKPLADSEMTGQLPPVRSEVLS